MLHCVKFVVRLTTKWHMDIVLVIVYGKVGVGMDCISFMMYCYNGIYVMSKVAHTLVPHKLKVHVYSTPIGKGRKGKMYCFGMVRPHQFSTGCTCTTLVQQVYIHNSSCGFL